MDPFKVIIVEDVNKLAVWSGVLVVLCEGYCQQLNFAPFFQIVEHGQRKDVVYVVSHVRVVNNFNGVFCKCAGINQDETTNDDGKKKTQ